MAAAEARAQGTLWIADDSASKIYQVGLDGTLISSFMVPLSSHSALAVDTSTFTLWGTSENAAGGRFVNFSRTGQLPPACQSCEPFIGASGIGVPEPEGIDVDPTDDTLWVVNDPLNVGTVFHLERDGTILSSFATADFDPACISPQAIAVDPFDGTLWITDNESRKVYNVTKTGSLISSASAFVYTGVQDPGIANPGPQGITVDRVDASLWVTDRVTNRIYNVDSGRNGASLGTLRFSFPTSSYDALSSNATAIAYDRPVGVPALPGWGVLALGTGLAAAGSRMSRLRRALR